MNKAATAKRRVLEDKQQEGGFFARVDQHTSITRPAMDLLEVTNSTAPTMGKIYHKMYEVGAAIEKSTAPYKEVAKEKFDDR